MRVARAVADLAIGGVLAVFGSVWRDRGDGGGAGHVCAERDTIH